MAARTERGTVAPAAEASLLLAAASGHDPARGVLGAARDDVDDPVDGVGAPQAASRPADDLDAFDVIEEDVLDVPVRPGEQRAVHAAPVDQDEHGPTQRAREPTDTDGPLAGVDAGHVHPRHGPQQLRDRPRRRAPDLVGRDHVDGRRRLEPLLGALGEGGDPDVRQLGQAQLGQLRPGGRRRFAGHRPTGAQDERGDGDRDQSRHMHGDVLRFQNGRSGRGTCMEEGIRAIRNPI